MKLVVIATAFTPRPAPGSMLMSAPSFDFSAFTLLLLSAVISLPLKILRRFVAVVAAPFSAIARFLTGLG